ncbi:MAG: DNA-binding protein [Oscillospiraceae bacterium]|nr:DNA-binding protein [Oscillospiraceae bacterium]
MEYQRFGNTIYLRLDRGDEVVAAIRRLAEAEGVKLASVTGLGATDDFTVGIFDTAEKQYHALHYTGAHEITSLVGSVNTMNGEHYSHLHMTASDISGAVVGGHLNRARISATAEIVIVVTDGTVDRFRDEAVGLNLYQFPEGKKL